MLSQKEALLLSIGYIVFLNCKGLKHRCNLTCPILSMTYSQESTHWIAAYVSLTRAVVLNLRVTNPQGNQNQLFPP